MKAYAFDRKLLYEVLCLFFVRHLKDSNLQIPIERIHSFMGWNLKSAVTFAAFLHFVNSHFDFASLGGCQRWFCFSIQMSSVQICLRLFVGNNFCHLFHFYCYLPYTHESFILPVCCCTFLTLFSRYFCHTVFKFHFWSFDPCFHGRDSFLSLKILPLMCFAIETLLYGH